MKRDPGAFLLSGICRPLAQAKSAPGNRAPKQFSGWMLLTYKVRRGPSISGPEPLPRRTGLASLRLRKILGPRIRHAARSGVDSVTLCQSNQLRKYPLLHFQKNVLDFHWAGESVANSC